jgi:hypothetical protein
VPLLFLQLIKVLALARCFSVIAMDEAEGSRVDGVTQTTAIPGAFRKHVSQVAVAMNSADFVSHHAMADIAQLIYMRGLDGSGKAAPSATRIKLV